MPEKLVGAIQAAEEFKELKMLGLLPPLEKVTAFEYECYRAAEYAANTVEAEAMKEASTSSSGSASPEKIGNAIPSVGNVKDSPFAGWE